MQLIVEEEKAKDYDSRYPILRPCDIGFLVSQHNYIPTDIGFSTKVDGVLVDYKRINGCYVPVKKENLEGIVDPIDFELERMFGSLRTN